MSPHDIALINRWNESKDPDAFAEIVRMYAGLVYGACLRVLRNAADAEDVAQECFMKVAEAPVSASTSLSGWLHTMATRKAINRLRSERRRASRETTYADSQSESAEAVWNDVQHLIDEAIANQPDDLRIPVIEHYLRGRTQESIGEELGISRQAVSRRIQKGVNKIRDDLRKKGLPVAPAIFAMGLEESVRVQPSPQLHSGLSNSAIGGIDSKTLGHVAATKTPWFLSPIALAVIAAIVALGGPTTWFAIQSTFGRQAPPASEPEFAATSVGDSDEADAQTDLILLAQNDNANVAATNTTPKVERAPDFRKFSLERPTPTPGIGALNFYVDSPKAVGTKVTLVHVNWKPWEEAPVQKLMFRQTIGEDQVADFKNLPLGDYHINLSQGSLGTNWPMTLNESMPGYAFPMNMLPRSGVELELSNEAGERVTGTRAFVYQHQLVGAPLESQLTDVWTNPFRENGNIAIDEIIVGGIKIYVEAEGYAPSVTDWIRSRKDPLPVLMTEGGAFSGRVVRDDGRPVEGVIVHVQGDYHADRGQAYTGDDGVAKIPNLRPGEYKVRVFSEEFVLEAEAPSVFINENETTAFGTIKVVNGTDIEGVVIDQETGQGIPGIRLSVDADIGVAISDLVTDESGYYTIPNASFVTYRVTRHSNGQYGYAAGKTRLSFSVTPQGIDGETDFELRSGIPVAGRVIDTDGRPVAGAILYAGENLEELSRDSNSDRFGNFVLNTVHRPGPLYVRARAAGYGVNIAGPFDVPEQGLEGIEVKVPHTASVTGALRIDGKFAPMGTWVWANAVNADTSAGKMGTQRMSTYSGPVQGIYLLSWLSPGSYDIAIQSPGGSIGPTVATVHLREGQLLENFDINYVTTGFELSGTVTDRNGNPVGNARIDAVDEQGGSRQVRSGGDGKFAFVGIGAGLYSVTANHAKHSGVFIEGVAVPGDEIRLELPNLGSISGVVRSAKSGGALTRFRIAKVSGLLAEIPPQLPDGRTISNENGEFRLDDVEIGDVTLIISSDGHAPALVHVPGVREGRTSNGVRVTLEAAAVLTGTVTDVEGNPVKGAFIHRPTNSYGYQGGALAVAKTDVNGHFEVDTLQEGEQVLAASHPDYAPQDFAVVLEFGEETEARVVMNGGASLMGIVYFNDVPMPGAMLTLRRLDGRIGSQSVQTDANGQYLFDNIPAGDYTVTAYIADDQVPVVPSEPFPIAFGISGTQLLDWTY